MIPFDELSVWKNGIHYVVQPEYYGWSIWIREHGNDYKEKDIKFAYPATKKQVNKALKQWYKSL